MVRRADEEHLGEIERHVQVVIAEIEVLFRVQRLKESRRGIAPEIVAELVDFVKDDHRVLGPGLLHGLNDAPRHGPDVGPAMAADFRLVAHPAEGNALELAAQRPGDGTAQRGLAHTGRAREAEDGPF